MRRSFLFHKCRISVWICFLLCRNGLGWLTHERSHHGTPSSLLSPHAPPPCRSVVSNTATTEATGVDSDRNLTAWDMLAGNMARCLISSDLKRDSGFDGSSTGWTSWVEESSAFRLQRCIDKLLLCGDTDFSSTDTMNTRRDDTIRWLRWMKSAPACMIVEMSDDLRSALDGIMTDRDYERVDQTPEDFLSRIACRILLFPSGATLLQNLQSPPGAMVYGKLLYGGVTRYRILGNTANANRAKRKAGERTVIAPPRTGDETVPTESWLQYGGPERCYSALDIGPCAVMEITILPKGLRMDSLRHASTQTVSSQLEEIPLEPVFRSEYQDMVAIQATMCDPRFLFDFPVASTNTTKNAAMQAQNVTPSHAENSCTIVDVKTRFSTTLGGLQPQIDSIIRRVLNGRVNPDTSERSTELQTLLDLGLSPVKGLLLYGLPGCGKTALARELSRLLTERPPKIVSAPELMDRWVGGTERLVRDLFQEAEEELRLCNGDVTKSGLHVVVIDEVDAVFRKRSASSGSGEVARASAVNQILAKMDGVNQLGNVLVIGTTNRRELLDEALLRPGRLEVQIHVPLPDREGRREILQLYFAPLRQQGRLSRPLCRAIDGQNTQHFTNDDVGSDKSWRNRLRRLPSISWAPRPGSIHDLAADRWTGGFSGADLEGLVRNAGSLALSRARKEGSGVDGLLITLEDVRRALQEATN